MLPNHKDWFMKFFDRKTEIEKLKEIDKRSDSLAQFTVLTGRRRIGKTSLLKKAYEGKSFVYLFVARKAERELCESFRESIVETLGLPMVGRVGKFAELFRFLMDLSTTRQLTVVIDEFQEFYRVNPSIYSDMQNIWDSYKDKAKMNLIVCGSVNSLINRIFRDKKEPLYGRQTAMMKIEAFTPSVLKEIMTTYSPQYSKEDLLALYLFTGGVAKYVEMLVDRGCMTKEQMLDAILERDGFFLEEGKSMLIEEFGRDYGNYFSILSLISQGHNTRGDIENILEIEAGGYIKKLMDDYGLIAKKQPLFEKSLNKNVHYELGDNFLRFWFRFIFRYSYIIEAGGYDRLRQIVERDYESYSGRVLEKYFADKLKEKGIYTRMGYWHSRNGENDIDIITHDELDNRAEFYEVKRQKKDIDIDLLKQRTAVFLQSTHEFKKSKIICAGLSMKDM